MNVRVVIAGFCMMLASFSVRVCAEDPIAMAAEDGPYMLSAKERKMARYALAMSSFRALVQAQGPLSEDVFKARLLEHALVFCNQSENRSWRLESAGLGSYYHQESPDECLKGLKEYFPEFFSYLNVRD